jgi:hypothetical protein
VCLAAAALTAASCSASGSGQHGAGSSAGSATGTPAAGPADPATPSLDLQAAPAAYQRPAAVSREVVLADGSRLIIADGLTPQSVSSDAVTTLNSVAGETRSGGQLASPTRDAVGAMLGGRLCVSGRGRATSVAAVQTVTRSRVAAIAGQLPVPIAYASVAVLGGTGAGGAAYLLGGNNGQRDVPAATTPGIHRGSKLRHTAECGFHADRHSYRPKLLPRMEWRGKRARLSRRLQEVPGGTW